MHDKGSLEYKLCFDKNDELRRIVLLRVNGKPKSPENEGKSEKRNHFGTIHGNW